MATAEASGLAASAASSARRRALGADDQHRGAAGEQLADQRHRRAIAVRDRLPRAGRRHSAGAGIAAAVGAAASSPSKRSHQPRRASRGQPQRAGLGSLTGRGSASSTARGSVAPFQWLSSSRTVRSRGDSVAELTAFAALKATPLAFADPLLRLKRACLPSSPIGRTSPTWAHGTNRRTAGLPCPNGPSGPELLGDVEVERFSADHGVDPLAAAVGHRRAAAPRRRARTPRGTPRSDRRRSSTPAAARWPPKRSRNSEHSFSAASRSKPGIARPEPWRAGPRRSRGGSRAGVALDDPRGGDPDNARVPVLAGKHDAGRLAQLRREAREATPRPRCRPHARRHAARGSRHRARRRSRRPAPRRR